MLIFNYDINSHGIVLCSEDISQMNFDSINAILERCLDHVLFRTPWSKFFKRNIVNTLRFNIQITIGEDTLFVLQYLQKCKQIFLSDQLYYTWFESDCSIKEKYGLSVEKAVYIVSCLYFEYKSLNIRCLKFEKFVYDFYYTLCEDDLFKNGTTWFKNRIIVQLWNNIKFSYSSKNRIMFNLKKYKFIRYFMKIYYGLCLKMFNKK